MRHLPGKVPAADNGGREYGADAATQVALDGLARSTCTDLSDAIGELERSDASHHLFGGS